MNIPHKARLTLALVASVAVLFGCQSPESAPASTEIESVSMAAAQAGDAQAERRLRSWAEQGLPVAQRELGLLYAKRSVRRVEAQLLLEHAAKKGDTEAAFQLAELLRNSAAPAKALPWYQQAAQQRHAKAALMLGLLFNNGEGTARDLHEGAHWLSVASDLGNAHAMFLLANAYREGLGVTPDPARAHQLLEEAAEHEYPPALQELAMTVQHDDAQRSAHLLKEATEHRRNNWNRF